MAYTAWSVIYGETPSAAKWNILGTNDASFNDGTGIASLTIKRAHLNTDLLIGASAGFAEYNGYLAGVQSTTSTSSVDVTNATCSITTRGGAILVVATLPLYCSSTTARGVISINGTDYNLGMTNQTSAQDICMAKIVRGLGAGTYVCKLRFYAQSGNTAYVDDYHTISIEAIELP